MCTSFVQIFINCQSISLIMVVQKDFERSGAPGYSLTTHGWEAWKLDTGKDMPYLDWLRMETERNNLFNGIWHMIVHLNTDELRRVYAYIRSLHP